MMENNLYNQWLGLSNITDLFNFKNFGRYKDVCYEETFFKMQELGIITKDEELVLIENWQKILSLLDTENNLDEMLKIHETISSVLWEKLKNLYTTQELFEFNKKRYFNLK